MLIQLFRSRFNPSLKNREERYHSILAEVREAVERYDTGHPLAG